MKNLSKSEIKRILKVEEGPVLEHFRKFPTFKEGWVACQNGGIMLLVSAVLKVDPRLITLVKAKVAREELGFFSEEVKLRTEATIKVSLDFVEGRATEKELSSECLKAYSFATGVNEDYYLAVHVSNLHAHDSIIDFIAMYCGRKEVLKSSAEVCRNLLTESVLRKVDLLT